MNKRTKDDPVMGFLISNALDQCPCKIVRPLHDLTFHLILMDNAEQSIKVVWPPWPPTFQGGETTSSVIPMLAWLAIRKNSITYEVLNLNMAIHYVIHNDGKTWATTAIDELSKGATLAVTMWGAIWSKWSLKSAQKGQFFEW